MLDTRCLKDKNGNLSGLVARAKPELVKQLLAKWCTAILAEAVYLEEGGIGVICPCGKPTKFGGGGYYAHCSVSCGAIAGAKRGKDHHLSTAKIRLKIIETNLQRYGVEHVGQVKKVRDKIEATCMVRYGKSSFLHDGAGKEKAVAGMLEKFRVTNISQVRDSDACSLKVRATMEHRGYWVPLDELPAYERYQRDILKLTNQNAHLIPNYDATKRGPHGKDNDNWQIDHRLSVRQGWTDGLTPVQMAHPANLQFVPWRVNIAKKANSDLLKDELLQLIEQNPL